MDIKGKRNKKVLCRILYIILSSVEWRTHMEEKNMGVFSRILH
jgi:hypothetical protein